MSSGVDKRLVWWLRRKPYPDAIRCATPEGEKVVTLDLSSAQKWSDTVRSVTALKSTRLEALDADGNVLRVRELEVPVEGEEPEEVEEGPDFGSTQMERLMMLNANLVAKAYEHSTNVAFSQMVNLFKSANEHTNSLARSLHAMERMQHKTEERVQRMLAKLGGKKGKDEEGDGDMGTLAELLKPFLEGANQARSNGAGAAPEGEEVEEATAEVVDEPE